MSKRGRQAGGETCRSADKQAERQEGRQAGGKGGRKESWWAGGRAGAGRQASRHNLQGLLLQLLLLLGIVHSNGIDPAYAKPCASYVLESMAHLMTRSISSWRPLASGTCSEKSSLSLESFSDRLPAKREGGGTVTWLSSIHCYRKSFSAKFAPLTVNQ